jgi:hypothetical protein
MTYLPLLVSDTDTPAGTSAGLNIASPATFASECFPASAYCLLINLDKLHTDCERSLSDGWFELLMVNPVKWLDVAAEYYHLLINDSILILWLVYF